MTDKKKLLETVDKWEKLVDIAIRQKSNNSFMVDMQRYFGKISNRQMDILIVLKCLNKNTISEIANYLMVSKSTLSIIMNKLVAKGLVKKEYPKGSDDGRRVYFTISDEGEKKIDKFGVLLVDALYDIYCGLTPEQRRLNREGIACLRQTINAPKTLFAVMMDYSREKTARYSKKYSEDFITMAKDTIFFLVDVKLSAISNEGIKLPNKVTQNQFQLLMCINNGLDTLTKLETHLGSSGSTLSIGVSKLVDKGLVAKNYPQSGDDGRKVYIKLTAEGNSTLKTVYDYAHQAIINEISSLDDEKYRLFDHGCDCLLKVMELSK